MGLDIRMPFDDVVMWWRWLKVRQDNGDSKPWKTGYIGKNIRHFNGQNTMKLWPDSVVCAAL